MIGRLFDELEKGVKRPQCWMDGHEWVRRKDGSRVCSECGAWRST